MDKIYAGNFFEFFAQVIGADVDELADFRKRKVFIRMLMDEFSRFPDFSWLRAFSILEAALAYLICGRHLYHPAGS